MERKFGRKNDELRKIKITRDYTKYADGSVLVEFGDTKVICTAKVEEKVPGFLRNTGTGWINAEYSMLPMSTQVRKVRDSVKGRIDGRNQEIQRLIGRSLRSAVDLKLLGERTVWVDCDVIQADGGTRTASITGGFVACCDAIYNLYKNNKIKKQPVKNFVSAISAGIVDDELKLDLCYEEDSNARVDMNIIMNNKGEFVEVQGTGEDGSFSLDELNGLIELARKGNRELIKIQREVLGDVAVDILGMEYEKEVVIATGNKNKLKEINKILEDMEIKVLSMNDAGLGGLEIEENGKSFEHNALIKAREVSKRTGKIAIADDSGLVVDALDGKPGIYSARYASKDDKNSSDEDNRKKLLKDMANVKSEDRTARFVCAIAVVFPDNKEFTVRGTCEGSISFEEIGTEGFGYDPLFIVDGYDKTFGEIKPEIKNKISHRAFALEKMKIALKKVFEEWK